MSPMWTNFWRRGEVRPMQSRGAATLTARSPNFSLVRVTTRSPLEADWSWVCRWSQQTGWSMSLMHDAALSVTDWYTSVQSLNSTHAKAGSQWSSINAAVTWSHGRRPNTRRAAELKTRCSAAIVDTGSPVSTALQFILSPRSTLKLTNEWPLHCCSFELAATQPLPQMRLDGLS